MGAAALVAASLSLRKYSNRSSWFNTLLIPDCVVLEKKTCVRNCPLFLFSIRWNKASTTSTPGLWSKHANTWRSQVLTYRTPCSSGTFFLRWQDFVLSTNLTITVKPINNALKQIFFGCFVFFPYLIYIFRNKDTPVRVTMREFKTMIIA